MIKDYLRIGSITKPHGLKGAVKIYPTTDAPERFDPGKKAYIRTKTEDIPVTIKNVSPFKNLLIVTFEEYGDINEIEGFKGLDIIVEKDQGDLSEGEFYIDDLIDMEVVDENDNALGIITEVIATGANDVYVVKNDTEEILIPAIEDCIIDVSLEENKMRVHLIPGL